VQKTYYPKKSDLSNQEWILIDAQGQNLGRLATRIAVHLLGKIKPILPQEFPVVMRWL
jgi:large subunit ribosomal protein L13